MRIVKIAVLALCTAVFWACAGNSSVPREEYDQLLQEYADLQAGAQATRAEYAAQAAAVDQILQELSQITGRTVTLRSDLEHGTVELTQVQQIEESIVDIKSRLAQLEKLSQQHKELQKMVGSLRTVIREKEAEIAALKEEIARRDATISEQHRTIAAQSGTIESQNQTISNQQENLRSLLAEQAQMLFQAGVDFENLGDQAPEVSRRKDKKKVQEFTSEMYRKAILYYQQAQAAGYPEAAYRMAGVEEKLSQL